MCTFHKNLFTFYSQTKYNLFTIFFLTFSPACYIIIFVKGQEKPRRGEKIFLSFFKKDLTNKNNCDTIKKMEVEKMKFTFVNLANANVQDICLQWENRNIIDIAWFEEFAIIISK